MMRRFLPDLRYAVRTLGRRPAFTAATVLTLAVGIGATTAIFTVADAVLLAPLAYPDPGRLVFLSSSFPGASGGGDQLSYLDIREIGRRTQTLDAVAAYSTGRRLPLGGGTGTGDPQPVNINIVAPEYLPLLGATLSRGRLFGPEDDSTPNGHPVAIVTDRFWRQRLAEAPDVVGRSIVLGDVALTIVGVLGPSFRDIADEEGAASASDVFVPAMMSPSFGGATYLTDRVARNYWGLARVRRGITIAEAGRDLRAIGDALQRELPATNRGFTFWSDRLDRYLARDIRGPIVLLVVGSAFVLLVGCANVTNLLLARWSSRAVELGVRRAVGARRGHIVSLVFAEAFVTSIGGGAIGLLLAGAGARGFRLLVPGELTPRVEAIGIDVTALRFAVALTLGVAMVLGLAGALRAASAPSSGAWRSARTSTDTAGRLRRLLLVAEVATAMILTIAAALMVESLAGLRNSTVGFRPERIVTFAMDLRSARYTDNAAVARFGTSLVESLGGLPGVESASTWGPGRPGRNTWVTFPGRADAPVTPERMMTWRHTISPGALRNIGIPLVRGREFTLADTAAAPRVAIVSETLASTLWPGEDAVGQRLRWRSDVADSPLLEVVGVAADAKHRGRLNHLLYPARDIYVPHAQRFERSMVVAVRTAGDPAGVVALLRAAVRRLDPELPLSNVTTMAAHLAEEEAETRFAAVLMTAYGSTALVLAAIGIFGVLSYQVSLRTREMAVRLALGATRGDVVRLIVADGMRSALAGVVVGLAGAAILTQFIASLLFGVAPRDPATFAGVAATLTVVAVVAAALPARRAAAVEPMRALAAE